MPAGERGEEKEKEKESCLKNKTKQQKKLTQFEKSYFKELTLKNESGRFWSQNEFKNFFFS